jgi:flagellar basal-body rod modification protein FlgD
MAGRKGGETMQSIQQIVTGARQMSSSATSVAGALAKPRATTPTTTPTTTSSATSTATITANDFLTLLVAEMKNQDPTQPTDPNAYITQMVGVNSLQQLVSINSGITSLDTATGATPTASGSIVTGTSPTANAQAMALVDAMPATSSGGSSAGSTGTSSGSSGANVSASGLPLWGSGMSN